MAPGRIGGQKVNWAGRGFSHMGEEMERRNELEAAITFFEMVGIDNPPPDAIDQLVEAFLPCLRIMAERGYDRDGLTWQSGGWRSQLVDIRKKFSRLWFHGWEHGIFRVDHPRDMINYLGFYIRLGGKGLPWGDWGSPRGEGEDGTTGDQQDQ